MYDKLQEFLNERLDFEAYAEASAEALAEILLESPLRAGRRSITPIPYDVVEFLNSKPTGPLKLAMIVSGTARQLLAIDRYERRVLARQIYDKIYSCSQF